MTSEIENIVLIVADALRPDRLGAYSGENLSPNIDKLAREGEVFEECYSCINATDSSVTTILTGLYPLRHGIINHGSDVTQEEQGQVDGTTPLPERLSQTHNTFAVDTLERWHKRGFCEYVNPRADKKGNAFRLAKRFVGALPDTIKGSIDNIYSKTTTNTPQINPSEEITPPTLKSIASDRTPFFVFAHYWDTHIPYVPPQNQPPIIKERTYKNVAPVAEVLEPIDDSPWAKRLKNNLIGDSATVADLMRKYDAGVYKIDQAVGQIVEKLKQEGIYDETAIILTSDHGESFTEHGIVFDHHGLYDQSIHVPLIIRAPGFSGRESQFVQHFDIVPTILDLLDKEYNDDWFDGVSLVCEDNRTLERNAVFAEEGHTARKRAIRTTSYKYIKRLDDRNECRYCEIRHAAAEELYDLTNDPAEEHNLAQDELTVKNQLDEQLTPWIESLPEPSKGDSTFGTSQEVKDHLEEMGYL